MNVLLFDGAKKVNLALHDVLYVPKIRNKLMSLPSMIEKGAEVQFKGQFCKVIINDKMYSIGHMQGKFYKLNSEPTESCCFGFLEKKIAPRHCSITLMAIWVIKI